MSHHVKGFGMSSSKSKGGYLHGCSCVGVRDMNHGMFTRCSCVCLCVNGCMWTCIRVSCVYSRRWYYYTIHHVISIAHQTQNEEGMVKRRGECGKEKEERIESER